MFSGEHEERLKHDSQILDNWEAKGEVDEKEETVSSGRKLNSSSGNKCLGWQKVT